MVLELESLAADLALGSVAEETFVVVYSARVVVAHGFVGGQVEPLFVII